MRDPAATTTRPVLDVHLEEHLDELTAFCRRMLGSTDAEDAVQETMARAWRAIDRFDGRSSLRTWLFSIAKNVCLDMLRHRRRRANPMDLGPASIERPPVAEVHAHTGGGDPAELVQAREVHRLAFGAAIRHLPPRQRGVLILRDVLCWRADEAAQLLRSSVASVNSALQRARATLTARGLSASREPDELEGRQAALLARYADAFERHDITSLVTLVHDDARYSGQRDALGAKQVVGSSS